MQTIRTVYKEKDIQTINFEGWKKFTIKVEKDVNKENARQGIVINVTTIIPFMYK